MQKCTTCTQHGSSCCMVKVSENIYNIVLCLGCLLSVVNISQCLPRLNLFYSSESLHFRDMHHALLYGTALSFCRSEDDIPLALPLTVDVAEEDLWSLENVGQFLQYVAEEHAEESESLLPLLW